MSSKPLGRHQIGLNPFLLVVIEFLFISSSCRSLHVSSFTRDVCFSQRSPQPVASSYINELYIRSIHIHYEQRLLEVSTTYTCKATHLIRISIFLSLFMHAAFGLKHPPIRTIDLSHAAMYQKSRHWGITVA